jgi:Family of unknown function (DUF6152)
VRTPRALAVAFAVMAVFSLLGGVVSAHHSRAGYDTDDKITTLKGIVTEVKWRNPHVFIIWGVKDDKGNVVQWTGEFSSPSTMISEGLSKDTFKAGDEVAVTVIPAKGGTPQGLVIKMVRPDGKVVIDLSQRRGLRDP